MYMTFPTNRWHIATATFIGCLGLAIFFGPTVSDAQVETWHIGKGGLTWNSQAHTQIGALDVDGALQPLELQPGENLIELLRSSGQKFLNGQPTNFILGGQPRTWSNDAFFNQLNGPLALVDSDPSTSSKGVFKTSQSQAGATFFWDLGAPFPVDRIRFFPTPDDIDAFIKAFELQVNDGETFNQINRPAYTLLRRIEVNKEAAVDIAFAPIQGRFLRLQVLSKSAFNLAEFEIYGQGFVPVASYESKLHSFGAAVNFGHLRVYATRLSQHPEMAPEAVPPTALIQMRTGSDDSPLSYFRRDRDTGSQQEVTVAEYNNNLPRRALYRQDAVTGAVLEEMNDRTSYLNLPVDEQGPVRDFIKGDIRSDVEKWSAWSPEIRIDSTGLTETLVGLPSPREFMQFRIRFDGDAENTIRIDTLQIEFSPSLVSNAIGEIALASNPQPERGVLEVEGSIDTTFIYDIRTDFDTANLAGYQGVRIEAFPTPIFERLEIGDPLIEIQDFAITTTPNGFDLNFPPINADNNQPLRVAFRMRVLEHNTPIDAWLLGNGAVPPHPIIAGNASDAINTGAINAFTLQAKPGVQIDLSTTLITPNDDAINETTDISFILSQFLASITVDIEIFDLNGNRIKQIVSSPRSAGAYTETWDGRNTQGTLVTPGIYLCRSRVEADSKTFEDVKLIGVVY